ncbi:MAG: hypothetical protein WB626_08115 [Bacteroidota bacterium]
MHPLSVEIITRDSVENREVHRSYLRRTRHPRWALLGIFLHALIHIRFR